MAWLSDVVIDIKKQRVGSRCERWFQQRVYKEFLQRYNCNRGYIGDRDM